ncbi:unnamed protein product, partial [Lymnaea stagnalis]
MNRISEMLTKLIKGPDENNPDDPLWSRLPTTALLCIYQNLGDLDRLSMARVCKPWYQSFHVPALWRYRLIEFGETRSKREIKEDALFKSKRALTNSYGKYAIEFAKRFPTSLQDIEIEFLPLRGRDGREIVNDFKEFSACLDNSKLRSISILSLVHLSSLDTFVGQLRIDLIYSLKTLLQKQHCLKKVRICSSHFDLESGLQFLQCLADASAATIKELFMYGLFQRGTPIFGEGRILTELQKFKSLSCIKLEYDIMSDELAKTWVRGCPNLS